MDEGTLNDLLECSVCLDRLDTSSKVLPCQHTFCKKCLDEIVQKHKELRCPECRVLVSIKVEDLPPNVLLMRILEGMRNAIPKKQRALRGNHLNAALHSAPIVHQVHERRPTNKQSTILTQHQPYAKALYDFGSKEAGDLTFKRGDTIILKKRIDNHWYQGECGGKQGVFPLSYVQIITPVPSHVPQCKALYDFRMSNDEEEGCLVFNKGDVINVIRRVDENWAEGKLEGRIGIFPLAFVELNNLARSLMKLSTNVQPGPSRLAPPTPTTEESTPLIPTDHTRTIVPQIHQPIPTSDSSSTLSGSSSSTTTPNVSSSNTSSSSSTAPSSPASPPPRNQPSPRISTPQRNNKEKRHSFTISTPHQNSMSTNPNRHSAEILSNPNESIPLPAAYTALYPYKPQKPDELELRKGAIYMVAERCQDGWYKGTSNRTQKCGVFPGNYVVPARGVQVVGELKCFGKGGKNGGSAGLTRQQQGCGSLPPELPPRSVSPSCAGGNAISSSWHGQGQQENAAVQIGRSSSAVMANTQQQANFGKVIANAEKNKDKQKGTVSLMRRLTSMKRSKSPPASSYSMDNPVFEDSAAVNVATAHPIHVRSGSCPSQLLQIQPEHRLFGSASQRLKHKERPSVLTHSPRTTDNVAPAGSSNSSPDIHHHRKSNSLDAGNKKNGGQTVRERFRCIAPYPPNSEYELELQVNDIIYVHKKREDGWYKGTQQRTGKTGLFPASFVDIY